MRPATLSMRIWETRLTPDIWALAIAEDSMIVTKDRDFVTGRWLGRLRRVSFGFDLATYDATP